jgi:hypothetical protein
VRDARQLLESDIPVEMAVDMLEDRVHTASVFGARLSAHDGGTLRCDVNPRLKRLARASDRGQRCDEPIGYAQC